MDLALNNLQWFICHKTKQNQTSDIEKLVESSLIQEVNFDLANVFAPLLVHFAYQLQ